MIIPSKFCFLIEAELKFFKCKSSNKKIFFEQFCDEFVDCPDGSDEIFCNFYPSDCPLNCNCKFFDIHCYEIERKQGLIDLFMISLRKPRLLEIQKRLITSRENINSFSITYFNFSKSLLNFYENKITLENVAIVDLSYTNFTNLKNFNLKSIKKLQILFLKKVTFNNFENVFLKFPKMIQIDFFELKSTNSTKGILDFKHLKMVEYLNLSFTNLKIEYKSLDKMKNLRVLDIRRIKIDNFNFLGKSIKLKRLKEVYVSNNFICCMLKNFHQNKLYCKYDGKIKETDFCSFKNAGIISFFYLSLSLLMMILTITIIFLKGF